MRGVSGRKKELNIKKIQRSAQNLWKDLQKSSRNGRLKADLSSLVSQSFKGMIGELKDLLPKEVPHAKVYFNRAGRKVSQFFIRQNRMNTKRRKSLKEKASRMGTSTLHV